MEATGRARATIARRLCTIAGFYRYAVEEVGALLVAAGLGTAAEHGGKIVTVPLASVARRPAIEKRAAQPWFDTAYGGPFDRREAADCWPRLDLSTLT